MVERHVYRYDTLGSTNDEAKRLAALGEPDRALVVADSQTSGRGRAGRRWATPPGGGLAMSLILRPSIPTFRLTQIALLGGLAALEGIEQATGLAAQLKWPNDVLIGDKKVAGVLAEAAFTGDKLESVVLGIGVNVNIGPPPDLKLDYPATCLADEAGQPLDREAVLNAILNAFDARYPQLGTPTLRQAWAKHLAMMGKAVRVIGPGETIVGKLEGVDDEGAILIRIATGEIRTVLAGDVHLRER
ncbi:MAG: biotin--[acetyl-CoA-carboxylase] ligase [Chloroflexi bacterium]|nr:biotin--[acetyl-CoA-carboxylase] ligase [Chloroflexota bacterium]